MPLQSNSTLPLKPGTHTRKHSHTEDYLPVRGANRLFLRTHAHTHIHPTSQLVGQDEHHRLQLMASGEEKPTEFGQVMTSTAVFSTPALLLCWRCWGRRGRVRLIIWILLQSASCSCTQRERERKGLDPWPVNRAEQNSSPLNPRHGKRPAGRRKVEDHAKLSKPDNQQS